MPVFSFNEIEGQSDKENNTPISQPVYDYCNENIEKFVKKVIQTFSTSPAYNYNFSGFAI